MPKVSVVTGYYNRAPVLNRTIRSILGQTFEDFELIVFDDCSTDNTREVLLGIQEEVDDDRLKIRFHERNIGFVQGMIEAISVAEGEFIAVQGSGDVSLPNRLEMQLSHFEDEDVGVVGSYYENVSEKSNSRYERRKKFSGITHETLVSENIFSHGEVMFRRTFYDAVGGYRPEFINCQDYDLWLRMIKVCRFSGVEEVLYRRYVSFDGVSYNPRSLIRQTKYSIICRKIATGVEGSEKSILVDLAEGRLDELVANTDPELQKILFRSAIRSLVFGGELEAREISRFIRSGFLSVLLRVIGFLYVNNVVGMRFWLLRVLGVERLNV